MIAEAFFDTNILVYAAAGAGDDQPKRRKALQLIDSVDFATSAQVLQEFYVTVVHKIEVPLSPVQALDWIEQLEVFPCLSLDPGLVKVAAEISQRHRISYWDGAIIAAAQALGTGLVYSEDLGHGHRYAGVEVRNPFVA